MLWVFKFSAYLEGMKKKKNFLEMRFHKLRFGEYNKNAGRETFSESISWNFIKKLLFKYLRFPEANYDGT